MIRFFSLSVLLIFVSNFAYAQEIGRADQALNDVVSGFVISIMTDSSSELYGFIRSMMLGLAFIGTVWHVMMWALKAISSVELGLYVLSAMLIFTIYANFNSFMSELWSWSDAIGLTFQYEAAGSRDPLFVGSELRAATTNFFTVDVSLWDGFNVISGVIAFKLVSMILSMVIFLISVWSVWGYAFMKITGLIFLPLLFLPITRSFFDKWFQIFLGFWFFNLFSKIALSLYHLYFFAIFGAVSDPMEFDPVDDRLALSRLVLHFLVGIVFLLSTVGFASVISAGFGGITGRASGVAQKMVAITTKVLTKI